MYILPRVVLFCAIFSCIAGIAAAQDVSINILNQPAAVAKGSSTGRVIIDICNNDGGIRTAAANKLRPLISLPSSLVGSSIVPVNIVGWTVLSNEGSNIRLENTLPIAPATCSQIEIGYTGVNVGGPLTITGTLGFNGHKRQVIYLVMTTAPLRLQYFLILITMELEIVSIWMMITMVFWIL
jgi:hypothetical protein